MQFLPYIRLALLCCLTAFAQNAMAVELIIVESDDCPYCERFHAEIGTVYPKTVEGKLAPLRSWQLGTPFPEKFQLKEPVRFTPTFILMDDSNNEVDRLVGYNGDEFFWFLLGEMLNKLNT